MQTQEVTSTPANTPTQVNWGELGVPPPPPVLIRQNAFDIDSFNVARRLEFDDEDEKYDTDLPFPLFSTNQ
jgi:hypothetical protein